MCSELVTRTQAYRRRVVPFINKIRTTKPFDPRITLNLETSGYCGELSSKALAENIVALHLVSKLTLIFTFTKFHIKILRGLKTLSCDCLL